MRPCKWVQASEILDGALEEIKWDPFFNTATPFSDERGTLACLADDGRHVILRHCFGWHFCVCGFHQHGAGRDTTTREPTSMQVALAHEPAQVPSVNVEASAGPLLASVRNALFPALKDAVKEIVKIQAKSNQIAASNAITVAPPPPKRLM
jgi:hypothetical protein